MEAAAGGRTAIGVDRDRGIGVELVADLRAAVDARADALVVLPGQLDPGALSFQQALELARDAHRVGVLGVPGSRLGADRVARLALAVSDGDGLVDLVGMGAVPAVVAGIDRDPLALERVRTAALGRPVGRSSQKSGRGWSTRLRAASARSSTLAGRRCADRRCRASATADRALHQARRDEDGS